MSLPERYRIGRPRPPHEPRRIQCASCGAPQSVRDERTTQLVCTSCGAALELTPTEIKVLRPRSGSPRKLPLDLDAPFRWKGGAYRVLARMVWSEEDDEDTVAYYLYSPRRGALWLECYENQWLLYRDTHLQPDTDPFKTTTLTTGDGRSWRKLEEGTQRLRYVDGALPWLLAVGDTTRYVAFTGKNGEIYDAERQGDEVEYALAERVDAGRLAHATGKAIPVAAPSSGSIVGAGAPLFALLGVSLAALAWNGVLFSYAATAGDVVLDSAVTAASLDEEALSTPFTVPHDGCVLGLEFEAPRLDDAWMAVDWALVRDGETVVHVDDADLEYYSGYEGGESWSEGSRSVEKFVRVPEAGRYQILLHGTSGSGESATDARNIQPLQLAVRTDALPTSWALAGMVVSGLSALILVALLKHRHDNR